MLDLYDEIDEDFYLFGVQTSITDEIKFIFLLNQAFQWKLKRFKDLDVTFGQDTFCYSTYLHEDRHNPDDYVYVVKNQSHEKIEENDNASLFQELDLARTKSLLNKHSLYQYLIKLPEETHALQIKHLTLANVEFIHNIQLIEQISKKEKKYFLI